MIELQKIDCNCSDCAFMIRDLGKRMQSVELHSSWQKAEFDKAKARMIKSANENNAKGNQDAYKALMKAANKMTFQANKGEAAIHYGFCTLKNKSVSFIPNTCQIDTQQCFKHRKEI